MSQADEWRCVIVTPKVCDLLVECEVEAQAAGTRFLPLAPLMPSQAAAHTLGWDVQVTVRDVIAR